MPVNCTLNFHTFLAPTLLPPNQALQFLSLHSRHLLPIKPLSIHTPLPYPFFPRFESQTLAPKIPDLSYTTQTMSENRLSSPLVFNPRASGNDIKISSLTIVVAAIFLFLTVIFVFLLYFYAKYYWGSRSTRRRARFIVAGGNPPVLSRGLDPTVLSSIPITLYKPSDFKDGLECAVCLSELASGEEARLLPKCNHGFHLECIDTWFQSHSTCPICRCTVGPEAVEDDGNRSDLPTNVLFWGNHNQVNTRRLGSEEENSGSSGSSEGALVISIPNRSAEGLFSTSASPLSTRRSQVEEMKSPVENKRSPATPNMWSLRRILSMGKRAGGSSSSSPRIGDVEQGLDGSGAENGEGSSRLA